MEVSGDHISQTAPGGEFDGSLVLLQASRFPRQGIPSPFDRENDIILDLTRGATVLKALPRGRPAEPSQRVPLMTAHRETPT